MRGSRSRRSTPANISGSQATSDEARFEALVRRHYDALYCTAWRWARSGAAAEDLVGEALLRVWPPRGRRFEHLDETALTRVMYRLFVDRAWRERPEPKAAYAVGAEEADGDGGATEPARNAARFAAPWRRLAREDRVLLALHDLEQRPPAAIAAIIRAPAEALEARVRRARVRLGKLLDPDRVVVGRDAAEEARDSASCRQAHRLLEEALADPDSGARSRLMQHTASCASCRHAFRALAYLRGERKQDVSPPTDGPDETLDAATALPVQGVPGTFWRGVLVGALITASGLVLVWLLIKALGPGPFP